MSIKSQLAFDGVFRVKAAISAGQFTNAAASELQALADEYLRLLRFETRHKAASRKGGKVKSEAKAQAARANASRPRPNRRKPTE